MYKPLAIHEILELHEMISFNTLCAVKAKTMIGLAQDQELKDLLQNDVNMKQKNLEELDRFIAKG